LLDRGKGRVEAGLPSQQADKALTCGASLITIYRHMVGRLTVATAAIMSVIVIEQILYKSPTLYNLVITGALSFDRLLLIWLHILPVIFYHATPEIVSIAVACRYYQWIENNELLTLRSAGRSGCQIACPGIIVALLAASFCALNSLYLLPLSWESLEDIRFRAAANVGVEVLQPGYQQEIIPGVSVAFARRSLDGTTLEDIVALDSRKEHEFTEIWSRRGRFLESDGASFLLLDSGAYFVRTATGIEKVDFDTFSLPVRIGTPEGTEDRIRGFYEEPVTRLLNPPIDVRNDALVWAQWLVEGHRRIVNPLLCVGNVVLVLGLLVPRRQGRRQTLLFILAIASAFATNTLPDPIIAMAIRDIELLPLLYLLPMVPAIVGGVLLAANGMRPPRFSGGGDCSIE
jgi:lipopolysaccharide export system permease protein